MFIVVYDVESVFCWFWSYHQYRSFKFVQAVKHSWPAPAHVKWSIPNSFKLPGWLKMTVKRDDFSSHHTVDGWNPANPTVVALGISEPSTSASNHHTFVGAITPTSQSCGPLMAPGDGAHLVTTIGMAARHEAEVTQRRSNGINDLMHQKQVDVMLEIRKVLRNDDSWWDLYKFDWFDLILDVISFDFESDLIDWWIDLILKLIWMIDWMVDWLGGLDVWLDWRIVLVLVKVMMLMMKVMRMMHDGDDDVGYIHLPKHAFILSLAAWQDRHDFQAKLN